MDLMKDLKGVSRRITLEVNPFAPRVITRTVPFVSGVARVALWTGLTVCNVWGLGVDMIRLHDLNALSALLGTRVAIAERNLRIAKWKNSVKY
jgi:hypothetical protein